MPFPPSGLSSIQGRKTIILVLPGLLSFGSSRVPPAPISGRLPVQPTVLHSVFFTTTTTTTTITV
jgi:hypothetical protein